MATFDNYAEGFLGASFTDPLSGITFRNPNPFDQFAIEYASGRFGGSNFLSGAFSPGDSWGLSGRFGFRGDLPLVANAVGIDVTRSQPISTSEPLILRGYGAGGGLVAERVAPPDSPETFHLQIQSASYDIAYFVVTGGFNAVGYKNVSYTAVPEPAALAAIGVGVECLRRRRRAR